MARSQERAVRATVLEQAMGFVWAQTKGPLGGVSASGLGLRHAARTRIQRMALQFNAIHARVSSR